MTAKKYQSHFFPNPLIDGTDVKHRIVMQGSQHGMGGLLENYWLRWNCIKKPISMSKPHTHDFDEIFHFFGGDPEDISDFQAIVEITMGPEMEIYTITTPTILYIPKGLVHAPFNFKVINKPIIFMNVGNAAEYIEKPYAGLQ